MKKLEEIWWKLTDAEQVTLYVLGEVLTNRNSAKTIHGATNARMTLNNLKRKDSTILNPHAQLFLENFFLSSEVGDFEEIYAKLMALI